MTESHGLSCCLSWLIGVSPFSPRRCLRWACSRSATAPTGSDLGCPVFRLRNEHRKYEFRDEIEYIRSDANQNDIQQNPVQQDFDLCLYNFHTNRTQIQHEGIDHICPAGQRL